MNYHGLEWELIAGTLLTTSGILVGPGIVRVRCALPSSNAANPGRHFGRRWSRSIARTRSRNRVHLLVFPLNYRILLRKEPEGGYTVTVPTLPGCVTFGETVEEAIAMAREAIELYLEDLREKGEEIPTAEGLLEYTLTVEAHA